MSLESRLVKKLSDYCKKKDIFYLNIIDTNKPGIPDSLLITREGRYIWLELKREDRSGRVSPLQTYRHDEMRGYKAEVYVVSSMDEIKRIINDK